MVARRLGIAAGRPHNPAMDIKSDNPEHGFQFPGTFEITAMGPATAGLETEIPKLLADAGIDVLDETHFAGAVPASGKFVSVKLSFRAEIAPSTTRRTKSCARTRK